MYVKIIFHIFRSISSQEWHTYPNSNSGNLSAGVDLTQDLNLVFNDNKFVLRFWHKINQSIVGQKGERQVSRFRNQCWQLCLFFKIYILEQTFVCRYSWQPWFRKKGWYLHLKTCVVFFEESLIKRGFMGAKRAGRFTEDTFQGTFRMWSFCVFSTFESNISMQAQFV